IQRAIPERRGTSSRSRLIVIHSCGSNTQLQPLVKIQSAQVVTIGSAPTLNAQTQQELVRISSGCHGGKPDAQALSRGAPSSHFLQASVMPILDARPSNVTTQGRF